MCVMQDSTAPQSTRESLTRGFHTVCSSVATPVRPLQFAGSCCGKTRSQKEEFRGGFCNGCPRAHWLRAGFRRRPCAYVGFLFRCYSDPTDQATLPFAGPDSIALYVRARTLP